MASEITEFLRDVVYPRIDAVDAGLLTFLRPKDQSTSGSYQMVCPVCGEPEAFHFPGSGYIQCPRKNKCGQSTSLWDALVLNGFRDADVVTELCRVANVEPPKNKRDISAATNSASQTSAPVSAGKAIFQVTQYLAGKHPALVAELAQERGLSANQLKLMKLGLYTTPEEVLTLLEQKGISKEVAALKGYVEIDPADTTRLLSGMTGRVVGYWPHPDGDFRLWGRLPKGAGDKRSPKYRFAPSLKKNIPYLFNSRKPSILVGVEGVFDAWALQLLDIWGCAVGQASVNAAQAQFFAEKGVTEYAQMLDGDEAGFDSGVTTIRNCEAAGIVTSIIPLGAGMDDADALRRSGKPETLHHLVAGRINAGEYLARMCTAYLNQRPANIKAFNRVISTSRCLTPASRAVWNRYASAFGYEISVEQEAASTFASLINVGFDPKEAVDAVARKTGMRITFQKEDINND
ncbi:hypothetical protein QAO71_17185 (plasmid) [Halopseudomonas sp. SMJS2]|uniref:hypothetical protein n=1 Tax=Halopseudomonas sp. SMJS2 TaxID=3041098 RepID=UPI00245307C2|nr:hypothetical protein [Halopseudomonas sp. SMJS2]WGK63502.1 hypothetical protein QAO71_17185 [Halopseudomonas sp. SMJS2]